MNQIAEAIAYHGWGFDHTCWQFWKTACDRQGIVLRCFDRGYFGKSVSPAFSPSSAYKLILTHSYGLHLCPQEHLHQADLIVILSGFQSFHPSQPTARRRSQLTLQQMIRQFEHSPQMVLETFWATCYHPLAWKGDAVEMWKDVEMWKEIRQEKGASLNTDLLNTGLLNTGLLNTGLLNTDLLNTGLLLQDLRALDTACLDVNSLKNRSKILIIHGASDRITPPNCAQDLCQALPTSDYVELPAAGHALPMTHLEDSWRSLALLLQGLPTS